MKCKNCDVTLRTDFLYCPACGAKVIRNRITVRNLWVDILERYFNLDNTFVNTFVHLITKPEVVIEGYIQGLRRKYLNPISYLAISLTLSGFIVFLMSKLMGQINFDIFNTGANSVVQEKMMDVVFDIQALVFVLYIPIMAIAGWLCFDQKKYNFSERTVIFMYTLAQYSLSIFLPAVVILIVAPQAYAPFSLLTVAFMFLYAGYVIMRISKSRGISLISRIFIFYLILGVLYMVTSSIIPLIMFITGNLELQDFAPVKN